MKSLLLKTLEIQENVAQRYVLSHFSLIILLKLGSPWSKAEIKQFYKAYRAYKKDWKKVVTTVLNRSTEMVEAFYSVNRIKNKLSPRSRRKKSKKIVCRDESNSLDANMDSRICKSKLGSYSATVDNVVFELKQQPELTNNSKKRKGKSFITSQISNPEAPTDFPFIQSFDNKDVAEEVNKNLTKVPVTRQTKGLDHIPELIVKKFAETDFKMQLVIIVPLTNLGGFLNAFCMKRGRKLSLRQQLIAIHPKIREVNDGNILSVEHDSCRVQFDSPELGVEHVTSQGNGHSGFGRPGVYTSSGHLENVTSPANMLANPIKRTSNSQGSTPYHSAYPREGSGYELCLN
ncbi:hypothetical protein V6N12_011594 [Hibiscus sabdariffa]|uniref:SANT domain-containing protein n=1 Tax=Hibiscus sabdariffa TaxID=183260 RepID=A0ABR2AYX6_9ROSI